MVCCNTSFSRCVAACSIHGYGRQEYNSKEQVTRQNSEIWDIKIIRETHTPALGGIQLCGQRGNLLPIGAFKGKEPRRYSQEYNLKLCKHAK